MSNETKAKRTQLAYILAGVAAVLFLLNVPIGELGHTLGLNFAGTDGTENIIKSASIFLLIVAILLYLHAKNIPAQSEESENGNNYYNSQNINATSTHTNYQFEHKKCPTCLHNIATNYITCPYCNYDFTDQLPPKPRFGE